MLSSNPYFDKLSQEYDPFYATLLIAKTADALYSELSGRIDISTAIDLISNEIPINPDDFPDKRIEIAKDSLSYVLDEEVKEAALVSYRLSIKYNNLVYKYLSVKEPYRQSRIRVLTNMLWGRWKDKFR